MVIDRGGAVCVVIDRGSAVILPVILGGKGVISTRNLMKALFPDLKTSSSKLSGVYGEGDWRVTMEARGHTGCF